MSVKYITRSQVLNRIRQINSFNFCNLAPLEVKVENENSNFEAKNIHKTKMSFFIPSNVVKKIDSVETVTGVYIGKCNFSWAKISIPNISLLEWNVKPLPEQFLKKNNELNTLQLSYKIRKQLPTSDLYVMETFAIRARDYVEKFMYINLSSMLIVLLNGINSDEMDTNVIFQKQQLVNKLHDLYIYNERISATPLVESMLIKHLKTESKGQVPKSQDIYSDLEVDLKYIDFFKNSLVGSKEDLSLVFLVLITFVDLYVFNNKNSWNKILKKTQKSEKSVTCSVPHKGVSH